MSDRLAARHAEKVVRAFEEIEGILGTADLTETVELVRQLQQHADERACARSCRLCGVYTDGAPYCASCGEEMLHQVTAAKSRETPLASVADA